MEQPKRWLSLRRSFSLVSMLPFTTAFTRTYKVSNLWLRAILATFVYGVIKEEALRRPLLFLPKKVEKGKHRKQLGRFCYHCGAVKHRWVSPVHNAQIVHHTSYLSRTLRTLSVEQQISCGAILLHMEIFDGHVEQNCFT